MPELYHKLPGEEYSDEDSQVLEWLQEECQFEDFNDAKRLLASANKHGFLAYDPDTGIWQGDPAPWRRDPDKWLHPFERWID